MEIITPEAPESMLSGEILNHFGGFLRRDIREWDFTAGYLDAYNIISQKFSLDAPLFEKQAEDLGSLTSAQFRHNRFIVKMIFRALWNMIREIVKMIYSMLKGGNG